MKIPFQKIKWKYYSKSILTQFMIIYVCVCVCVCIINNSELFSYNVSNLHNVKIRW
jgi:hypothetical protein